MEKASCWKARQTASRRRRRKRSIAGPSLGPGGAGCNEGSGPGSSVGMSFGFACMSKGSEPNARFIRSQRTRTHRRASLAQGRPIRAARPDPSATKTLSPQDDKQVRGRTGLSKLSSPPSPIVVWLTPPPVPRSRPRGASSRERARLLRMQPRLPPVPWPRPLPSLARGARSGSTPCRYRQG
jgi:hypothetical protein